MKKKFKNLLLLTGLFLTGVGGLVHLASAYSSFDILGLFKTWAPPVQLIVGIVTLITVFFAWKK